MQLTCEGLVDNHQIQVVESGNGFGPLFDHPQDIPQKAREVAGLAEYEHITFAELIEELMEIRPVHPDILRDVESEATAEIGPRRLARLKSLLLSVWQDNRMI